MTNVLSYKITLENILSTFATIGTVYNDIHHKRLQNSSARCQILIFPSSTDRIHKGWFPYDCRQSQRGLFPYNRRRSQTMAEPTVAINFVERKYQMYARVVLVGKSKRTTWRTLLQANLFLLLVLKRRQRQLQN